MFSTSDYATIDLITEYGPSGYEMAVDYDKIKSFGELRATLARIANYPNNLAWCRQRNQGVLVADMWATWKYSPEQAEELTRSYANADGMVVHAAKVVTLPQVDTHIVILKVSV